MTLIYLIIAVPYLPVETRGDDSESSKVSDGDLIWQTLPRTSEKGGDRVYTGMHTPYALNGSFVKYDEETKLLTITRGFKHREHIPQGSYEIRLTAGCKAYREYEPTKMSSLSPGDTLNVWLEYPKKDKADTYVGERIDILKGIKVSDIYLPSRDALLKPDATGMLFFDDFETGDFSKWHFVSGCSSITTEHAISGGASATFMRRKRPVTIDGVRQRGTGDDYVQRWGFPQIDEVWMKFKFTHWGEPRDTEPYAIFRPFPKGGKGAQVFAVRIIGPMQGGGGFKLCNQTVEGAVGKIDIEPNRTYTIKFHWKRSSPWEADNGTMETWIDGQPDISMVGNASTLRYSVFDFLDMGMLHSGSPASGGTIFLDDVWVGIKDPDASVK